MVKRKEKWAEQKKEEEKRKPDPDCPKGHKRVPEEERRKVLEKLKKCKFDMSLGTKLLLWQFYGFIRLHSRVPHNLQNINPLSLAQKEYEDELLSLPVRQCDTLKYKQRKMELEGKLTEIDEAIKECVHNVFFVDTSF